MVLMFVDLISCNLIYKLVSLFVHVFLSLGLPFLQLQNEFEFNHYVYTNV